MSNVILKAWGGGGREDTLAQAQESSSASEQENDQVKFVHKTPVLTVTANLQYTSGADDISLSESKNRAESRSESKAVEDDRVEEGVAVPRLQPLIGSGFERVRSTPAFQNVVAKLGQSGRITATEVEPLLLEFLIKLAGTQVAAPAPAAGDADDAGYRKEIAVLKRNLAERDDEIRQIHSNINKLINNELTQTNVHDNTKIATTPLTAVMEWINGDLIRDIKIAAKLR